MAFNNQTADGTTSAYAENTLTSSYRRLISRNYLRVRGEYHLVSWTVQEILELPPRTRRIQAQSSLNNSRGGTTSAYAENTHIRR